LPTFAELQTILLPELYQPMHRYDLWRYGAGFLLVVDHESSLPGSRLRVARRLQQWRPEPRAQTGGSQSPRRARRLLIPGALSRRIDERRHRDQARAADRAPGR
jgi:hypothetical protein